MSALISKLRGFDLESRLGHSEQGSVKRGREKEDPKGASKTEAEVKEVACEQRRQGKGQMPAACPARVHCQPVLGTFLRAARG